MKRPLLVPFLILLLATALFFVRGPDRFTHPMFYAEEGAVLYPQAPKLGLKGLFIPSPPLALMSGQNYLIFGLRLPAYLGQFVEPVYAPAFYNLCALLIRLFLIGLLFSPRLNLPLKPLLGIAVAAIPHNGELLMSLIPSHLYFAPIALLLIMMQDPDKSWQWLHDVVLLLVIGLSSPFAALFLPLFAIRAWTRRTKASYALLVLAIALTVVQVAVTSATPDVPQPAAEASSPINSLWLTSDHTPHPFAGMKALLAVWSRRVVFYALIGKWKPPGPFDQEATIAIAAIVLGLLFAAAWRHPEYRAQKLWIWGSMLLVLLGAEIRGRTDLMDFNDLVNGDRYYALARLSLTWLILMEAAAPVLTPRSGTRRAAIAILAVMLWRTVSQGGFYHAPLKDFHWEQYAGKVRRGEAFVAPINPPGWVMRYPDGP